jgi:hypothetical protein
MVKNTSTTMLKLVDHTYSDFSRYIEEGGQLCKHKKSGNNFPARLHKILSDAEHSHLITWMVRSMLCADGWIPPPLRLYYNQS